MKFEVWKQLHPDPKAAEILTASGIPPLAASVLSARGFTCAEDARKFLSAGETPLCDPFLLRDMDAAVSRLMTALNTGEKIAVYGDYDVDGITATCLLTDHLRRLGGEVIPYVPDRLSEGYSLNTTAMDSLKTQGVSLIVTVDCGITNMEEVAYARSLGLDVVITDHHECKEQIPDAAAVVNPHRPDCPSPFKELAGVGVALYLALALSPETDREQVLQRYCDLAAIGTVADVMSLTDVNRTIVSRGLSTLEHSRRPGLRMLLAECGLEDKPLTSSSVSFSLAPRINAAGRMGVPSLAVELLLTEDLGRGAELALSLCDLNRTRQRVEQEIFAQCLDTLEKEPDLARSAIILADHHWHQGVVGIVASRLAEQYSVPVFMICLDGDMGKGSCRSYGDINLFQALEACQELLVGFGGHEMAAGFTIRESAIPAFRQKMRDIAAHWNAGHTAASTLQVDVTLENAQTLTLDGVDSLQLLEPFGSGNPQPVFLLERATAVSISPTGKGRHTRMKIAKDGVSFDAILFSYAPEELPVTSGGRLDLAFFPQINEFRGLRSVQLLVTDLRPSLSLAQLERSVYQRWTQGEVLSPEERNLLLPQRQDFVAVWRYITSHAAARYLGETPGRLSRNIARAMGRRDAYARTMICLEVLEERGLITLVTQTNFLEIRILPAEEKVDLEASVILRRLKEPDRF